MHINRVAHQPIGDIPRKTFGFAVMVCQVFADFPVEVIDRKKRVAGISDNFRAMGDMRKTTFVHGFHQSINSLYSKGIGLMLICFQHQMGHFLFIPNLDCTAQGLLEGIAGVQQASVAEGDQGRIVVETDRSRDLRPEIARLVVGRGFELLELKLVDLSLEDIFMQLVTDEPSLEDTRS